MTDKELLTAYLAERRKSTRDSRYYALKAGLMRLIVYLEREGLRYADVRLRDAEAYQQELVADGFAKTTVGGYMAEAIVFYAYLKREQAVCLNPFREVIPLRKEKKLPRNIPKEQELAKFLEELAQFEKKKASQTLFVRYRSHVAAELLYATGMRIGEAGRLKAADVDLERGIVFVRESKNGRSRVCFLSDYVRRILELYLNRVWPHLAIAETGLVFGVDERVLKKKTNQVLKAHADAAKITCHALRHAFGSHLLKAGCDIRYIQTLLGHSWLKTTQIYTKVEKEDLRAVLDRYHPRNLLHQQLPKRA